MSQEGTKRSTDRAFKRDLLKRLKVLAPQPGQVLLLEMPAEFFRDKDAEQHAIVREFADTIAKHTGGRDVFLVPEGTIKAVDDPRLREKKPAPDLVVPLSKIVLPAGVKVT